MGEEVDAANRTDTAAVFILYSSWMLNLLHVLALIMYYHEIDWSHYGNGNF